MPSPADGLSYSVGAANSPSVGASANKEVENQKITRLVETLES